MYNSLKFVAWAAALVVFVGVGKRVMNGLRESQELPQTTVSRALIRQGPNAPPNFPPGFQPGFQDDRVDPSSLTEKPSDETIKAAILAVRHPPPAPEDGYEVHGVGHGTVEILRQSDFDEANQELRVAALITADVNERARQAPSPFDKFQVIRCKYSLVEYYRVKRDRSGNWTALTSDFSRNTPQMQCRN